MTEVRPRSGWSVPKSRVSGVLSVLSNIKATRPWLEINRSTKAWSVGPKLDHAPSTERSTNSKLRSGFSQSARKRPSRSEASAVRFPSGGSSHRAFAQYPRCWPSDEMPTTCPSTHSGAVTMGGTGCVTPPGSRRNADEKPVFASMMLINAKSAGCVLPTNCACVAK